MSEGTSTSSSYDEGSRSTPSNLPQAATRARKKRTSNYEDEDYVAVEDEATSKKTVMKEYVSAATTKPGMNKKAPAKRIPMSRPEPPLKKLWSSLLNPKRPDIARRGKRRSRRTLPECLVDPPS